MMLRNLLIVLTITLLQACSSDSSSDVTAPGTTGIGSEAGDNNLIDTSEEGDNTTSNPTIDSSSDSNSDAAANTNIDTTTGTTNPSDESGTGSTNESVSEPPVDSPAAPTDPTDNDANSSEANPGEIADSDLDETDADTNPSEPELADPVQATLVIAEDKTFRLNWPLSERADFYRVLENPDGVSGFIQISDDLTSTVQTYDQRVALYKRINAQYIVQACNSAGCEDSETQMVSGNLENAIGYFKASNTDQNDRFNVVSISADGNTLAVGAALEASSATGINGEQNDNTFDTRGAVYVFERTSNEGSTGEVWQQQAYLKPSNNTSAPGGSLGPQFGSSLSLSSDGNTLVVGAATETGGSTGINGDQNQAGGNFSGAAYVFQRTDSTWTQQAYIKASNSDEADSFGIAVSLSANGNTLAVSANNEDSAARGVNGNQSDNSSERSGAVYVFVRSDSNWQQQAYLKAGTANSNSFGTKLSLSSDGKTLAVSETGNSSSGAIYVFALNSDSWQQQALLKASNTDAFDNFGIAVSLSGNGNTLAVGAQGEDSNAAGVNGDQTSNGFEDSGAAYVFVRNNEQWQQQAYLKASNPGAGVRFGSSISINSDGSTLAVGAPSEDSNATGLDGNQSDDSSNNSGAAYVFIQTDGIWQQQAYVKSSNSRPLDRFGSSISLSSDGNSLAIGALLESGAATGFNGDQTISNPNSVSSGAVYLY